MRIRQLNHCVYQVQYHIVWTTKYRRKIIKDYVKKEILKSIFKTLKLHPEWYIHDINTDVDHIHILMEIPPKDAVSDAIKEIKAYSSGHLRKRFTFIDRIYQKSGIWSVGYFVSTVGANEEIIKKYIQRQGEQDKGIDVTDEFS